LLAAAGALVAGSAGVAADSGAASTTLSFFSGGDGAHADWLATTDQPPGDTDNQAVQLQTTNDAPTFAAGYAGILFHHVTGIPAAAFPDSEFWVRSTDYAGPSLASPRLVVEFQTPAGTYDGNADLRPQTLTGSWQDVSDVNDYPNSAWDVSGGGCPFVYNTTWPTVQSCFAGDTVLSVFIVGDPYGYRYLIDDMSVNGKRFSSASDNGGGNNTAAGPAATTDPSLLPAVMVPAL